jgi:hypothetical protein
MALWPLLAAWRAAAKLCGISYLAAQSLACAGLLALGHLPNENSAVPQPSNEPPHDARETLGD